MADDVAKLKQGLAFAIAAVASEHFFSAGLSSPWSTAKFTETDEDKRIIWKLFWIAAGSSAVFAVALALVLGNGGKTLFWSLVGSGAISAWMYWEYDQAMKGTL